MIKVKVASTEFWNCETKQLGLISGNIHPPVSLYSDAQWLPNVEPLLLCVGSVSLSLQWLPCAIRLLPSPPPTPPNAPPPLDRDLPICSIVSYLLPVSSCTEEAATAVTAAAAGWRLDDKSCRRETRVLHARFFFPRRFSQQG